MTDVELAWAAGLFEGEGTVRINKPTKRNLGALLVSVVNTDRQVVEFFQERWPGYLKPATGLRPDQRPAWVWVRAARQAAEFLEAIQPFVRTERVREKLEFGLFYQRSKRTDQSMRTKEYRRQQWAGWVFMGILNQRGVVNAANHIRTN